MITRSDHLLQIFIQGGYTESPFDLSYTFNFWSACDTFIYFSHHRITIPPPGWINAAHRQGVKILGTLIFEENGETDCLRLLVGKMPQSGAHSVEQSSQTITLPMTPYYAKSLARLAQERGFDGYLLNFECPLRGGPEQTRALAAWITLLHSEIIDKVGPHGQTIWYDSVIFTGQLAWQDRLNSLNLPFFLSSSGFFSNYTWHLDNPNLTAQYFLSLDPTLTGNTPHSLPHTAQKSLKDIYMGVDVWGRGSHGGGGFGSYKAINHISPDSLGLSVALFGQAWTWESEQDKPAFNWEHWWAYESKLWVGPISGEVQVPEAPKRKDEPDCIHGPFTPISSFFSRLSPPDPIDLPFHTTFSPGVGRAWFVEGRRVFTINNGWTDVDKQTTVGDMVWPRPKLQWESDLGYEDEEFPEAFTAICMDDAWNGGTSLRLSLSDPDPKVGTAEYRSLWLPIQSLTITPQTSYIAEAIFKVETGGEHIELDIALSAKVLLEDAQPITMLPATTITISEPIRGWSKLSVQINDSEGLGSSTSIAMGLVITILTEDSSKPLRLSMLVGQLNIYPLLPNTIESENDIKILWADFQPAARSDRLTHLSGQLLWEIATSLPRFDVSVISPSDPVLAWKLQPSNRWFPSFIYHNIYALPFLDEWNVGRVEDAVWIGTSGLDGEHNRFTLTSGNLPFNDDRLRIGKKVRFYVQGVNDRGQVLTWDKCAYVDVSLTK